MKLSFKLNLDMIIIVFKPMILFILGGSLFGQIMNRPMMTHTPIEAKKISNTKKII